MVGAIAAVAATITDGAEAAAITMVGGIIAIGGDKPPSDGAASVGGLFVVRFQARLATELAQKISM